MFQIIYANKPLSQNARTSALIKKYRRALKAKFVATHPGVRLKFPKNKELYGIVYYFHKKKIRTDADNLSKPLWDSLEKVFYDNDNVVKYRQAGTLFTQKKKATHIDIKTLSNKAIRDQIVDFTVNPASPHEQLLYVELGNIRKDIYKFELE